MKPRLLIVDDDEAIRTQMKWALSQDYDVCFAEDRRGAIEAFEANSPAVTLLDLGLPPRPNECDEGMAALSDILAIDSAAKVIVVDQHGRVLLFRGRDPLRPADGSWWFETGRSSRKGRNLARDPRCTLSVSAREFDLSVSGEAALVTDPATVADMAGRWAADGWARPTFLDASGAMASGCGCGCCGTPPRPRGTARRCGPRAPGRKVASQVAL